MCTPLAFSAGKRNHAVFVLFLFAASLSAVFYEVAVVSEPGWR